MAGFHLRLCSAAWLSLAVAALVAFAPVAASAQAAAKTPTLEDLFPDEVIAKGQGFEIKRSELEKAYGSFSIQESGRGRPIALTQREAAETQVLDRLIITRLLLKRAIEADRKSGREKAQASVDAARKEAASETSFVRRIQAVGLTVEEMTTRLYEQNVCDEVLNRELFSKIKVSDEQLKKHHAEHPDQFRRPETLRASHILLAMRDRITQRELTETELQARRKLATELRERAAKGEDFATLVRQYTDDSLSRETAGEYTFARGKMVTEFETAAFALRTNEVSQVVTSRFGFHIIKLLERIPARTVPLKEVEDEVRAYLQRELGQDRLKPYFNRLKSEANLSVTHSAAKDVMPPAKSSP